MSHPVYNGSRKEIRFGDVYYLYHCASGEYIRKLSDACILTTPKKRDHSVKTTVCVVGDDYGRVLRRDDEFNLLDVKTTLFLTNAHDRLELSREPGKFKVCCVHQDLLKEPYIYLNINDERLCVQGPPYRDLIFDKHNGKSQEYEFEFTIPEFHN